MFAIGDLIKKRNGTTEMGASPDPSRAQQARLNRIYWVIVACSDWSIHCHDVSSVSPWSSYALFWLVTRNKAATNLILPFLFVGLSAAYGSKFGEVEINFGPYQV